MACGYSPSLLHFYMYIFTTGSNLLPDYFLDDAEELVDVVKETAAKKEGAKSSKTGAIFQDLSQHITEDIVKGTQCTYLFDVDGEQWLLDLKNGAGSINKVGEDATGDVTMTMKEDMMVAIFTGKQKAATAYMTGRLKIKGDLGKAMKLEKLMSRLQKNSKL